MFSHGKTKSQGFCYNLLEGTATQIVKSFPERCQSATLALQTLTAQFKIFFWLGLLWLVCRAPRPGGSLLTLSSTLLHPVLQSLSPGAPNAHTTPQGLTRAPNLISNVLVPERIPTCFPSPRPSTK